MKNEVLSKLILKYLAVHPKDYSIQYLSKQYGVSQRLCFEYIDDLMDEELLSNDDGTIRLTFAGRMKLQKDGYEPDILQEENDNSYDDKLAYVASGDKPLRSKNMEKWLEPISLMEPFYDENARHLHWRGEIKKNMRTS